jgi:hypothetical protein
MEVDGLVDGMAVGRCLRVKVRMMITKPLMRGTMVEIDGGKRAIWCPFEYEYCPDFCFVCGCIGHIDKDCESKLKKGEEPQFGRWLKWFPPRRTSFNDNRRNWNDGGRRMGSWGSGSSGRGSDAKSWRKQDSGSKDSNKSIEEGKEVTSPLKITEGKEAGGSLARKKHLSFGVEGVGGDKGVPKEMGKGKEGDVRGSSARSVDSEEKMGGVGDSQVVMGKGGKAAEEMGEKDGLAGSGETPK